MKLIAALIAGGLLTAGGFALGDRNDDPEPTTTIVRPKPEPRSPYDADPSYGGGTPADQYGR